MESVRTGQGEEAVVSRAVGGSEAEVTRLA
jgi:hypothetical protein